MAKHIKDIFNEVEELNLKIKQVLYHAEFENYDDLSGLEYDRADAEQLFMLDELYQILSKLDDVSHTLNYLDKPIKAEGALHKNANGRYEVQGIELSSGQGLEYLSLDDRHCRYNANDDYVPTPYWCSSRMEHNGTDYYIVGATEFDTLENVRVRIRK